MKKYFWPYGPETKGTSHKIPARRHNALHRRRKDKSKLQNQLVLASSVEKFEKSGGVDSWTDEQKAWFKQLQGAVKKYAYNGVKLINSQQAQVGPRDGQDF